MFCITSRLFLAVTLAATVAGRDLGAATAQHPRTPSRSELRAMRILERHRARREFPGAVLALRDPAGASFTVTAGVADPAKGNAPIDVDTPWIIGSATKTFVAVVVLQLAQEGKLDLDATVGSVALPAASRITTRQLLQHTSGLREYLDSDAVLNDARREWSARELIAAAVAKGPVAEPGAGYHHANTNYVVLGELIEKVTSRPWYAEVRSRIIEPLGLRHTGSGPDTSSRRGDSSRPPIGGIPRSAARQARSTRPRPT